MKKPVRVVQYGLGPIGLETVRTVLAKQAAGHVSLVGAIDIDPEKVGRDVADLTGSGRPTGILVSADARQTLEVTRPDVVLHTTSSFLGRMDDQLLLCAEAGAHVVSSTEELSYPFDRHPEISKRIDEAAKANGVVILGTGVNPGYAMDALALMATGVCTEVHGLKIERVVDAGKRRLPLQRKVGAGISAEEFAEKKATGTFGHIGLRESLLMVADALDWTFDDIEETLNPVISEKSISTPFLTVKPGDVAGIHHAIVGRKDQKSVLSLDLKMFVGAENPRDAVHVDGTPPIDLVIQGGIFGDTATVAALVNAISLVFLAQPGLQTMATVPLPRAFGV